MQFSLLKFGKLTLVFVCFFLLLYIFIGIQCKTNKKIIISIITHTGGGSNNGDMPRGAHGGVQQRGGVHGVRGAADAAAAPAARAARAAAAAPPLLRAGDAYESQVSIYRG